MKFKLKVTLLGLAILILMSKCKSMEIDTVKPRVLISSDIGGTDPDDFQSMIHLLMYADQFEIEGLVASPFGDGRKSNYLDIIDDYEKDYAQLAKHASDLPKPAALRAVVKQGAIPAAPFK